MEAAGEEAWEGVIPLQWDGMVWAVATPTMLAIPLVMASGWAIASNANAAHASNASIVRQRNARERGRRRKRMPRA